MLTDEQKNQASQAFVYLDEAGTNQLPWSRDTLTDGARLAGLNPDKKEVDEVFQLLDKSQSTIDKDQFLHAMSRFTWKDPDDVTAELTSDFQLLETVISGGVDPSALSAILGQEGSDPLPAEDVAELVAMFPTNSDGRIPLGDMIQKLIQPIRAVVL